MLNFVEAYLKAVAILFMAFLLALSVAIPADVVARKHGVLWGTVTAFIVLALWIACAAYV